MSRLTPLAACGLQVSVLMATRDRASILDRCLRAFESVNAEGITWELIVVNDGEDPRTEEVLDKHAPILPLIRRRSAGGEGKNRSLNLAVPDARGALFAFVDDDILPARDWLTRLTGGVDRWPQHDVFGGRILPDFPGEVPGYLDLKWSRMRDALAIGDWGMAEGTCDSARVWGGNMAVRRSVFTRHRFDESRGPGGLHYVMGGDSEFILRVVKEGTKAIHLPDWTVEHIIRAEQLEPDWLKARAFRAGRHDACVAPDAESFRVFGAPAGLYLDAGRNLLLALVHRRDPREALKNWMWYQLARGQIHQHRLMRRDER